MKFRRKNFETSWHKINSEGSTSKTSFANYNFGAIILLKYNAIILYHLILGIVARGGVTIFRIRGDEKKNGKQTDVPSQKHEEKNVITQEGGVFESSERPESLNGAP